MRSHEHKAVVFSMAQTCSVAQPHMRAFWAATAGFCASFFSVFSPAALMPYLQRARQGGGIGLTLGQITDSDTAALSSTILMRLCAGPLCEHFGAKRTLVWLLLAWSIPTRNLELTAAMSVAHFSRPSASTVLAATRRCGRLRRAMFASGDAVPGIVLIMFVQGEAGFIGARLIMGISLASFVVCQAARALDCVCWGHSGLCEAIVRRSAPLTLTDALARILA